MLDIRKASKQIRFSGAAHVELLADKQKGPTCGFEAIENIIQLFYRVGNNLVEADLIPRAIRNQGAVLIAQGYRLDVRVYQKILQEYKIESHWYPFDHNQLLIPALSNNRGVLIVGDAFYLNSQAYPMPGSPHAFVITNYYTDVSEHFVQGYVGIDSNFENREICWPLQNIEYAAQWGAQNIISNPVLVTDIPINYPSKARYYKITNTGDIAPVY